MFKMSIPVVLVSVKAAKDAKSSNYADFLYTGGSASLAVDDTAYSALKGLEGTEFIAAFQMKPGAISRFNRSVAVFEFLRFLEIEK